MRPENGKYPMPSGRGARRSLTISEAGFGRPPSNAFATWPRFVLSSGEIHNQPHDHGEAGGWQERSRHQAALSPPVLLSLSSVDLDPLRPGRAAASRYLCCSHPLLRSRLSLRAGRPLRHQPSPPGAALTCYGDLDSIRPAAPAAALATRATLPLSSAARASGARPFRPRPP